MRLWKSIRYRWALRSLSPQARAVLHDRLTYLPIEKLRRLERAIERTRATPGDIIEFGVALGGSGILLARGARSDRRFIGLDVFGMIPPPTSDKDDEKSKSRYETIRAGQSKGIGGDEYYGYRSDLFTDVCNAFARHGVPVDGNAVILLKGLFSDTWPSADVTRIALAHIDCDWYDPVRYCLHACADIMSTGGIIIIDDYNDYGGCRKAVDEFLAERPDFALEAGLNPFLVKS